MAFIVEQFVGDKGIQIGYEEVIRPFSFGTNWQKIRVGVLCALNGYSNMPAFTYPHIGICTGNNGRWSNSCTDALWTRMGQSTSGSMIYSGTPPAVFYALGDGTSSNIPAQRVGSADVNLSAGSPNMFSQISANPPVARTGFMFTITKGTVGAASIGCDWTFHTGGGVAGTIDVSRGTFLAGMESETTAVSPMTMISTPATNLPTRFVKDWDSMFVGWSRATPTLCIYCMTVVRFL